MSELILLNRGLKALVSLPGEVSVPEYGHDLYENHLVIQRDEGEVDQLDQWPDFVICQQNVCVFRFEFPLNAVHILALESTHDTDEGGQKDRGTAQLVHQDLLNRPYRRRSSLYAPVQESVPVAKTRTL